MEQWLFVFPYFKYLASSSVFMGDVLEKLNGGASVTISHTGVWSQSR